MGNSRSSTRARTLLEAPRRRFAAALIEAPRRRFAAALIVAPRRRFAAALGCAVALFALAALGDGCGPVLYTTNIHAAEQKLQLAREENARWYAPYEYYFAEAHLQQSERLAAESAYEDAIRYAKIAEDFSGRALEITRRKRLTER